MPKYGPETEAQYARRIQGKFKRSKGRLGQKVQRVGKKVLGRVKQLLKAKHVRISGTGRRGARISGRGDYSITEMGSAVAAPFFDDTRSKGTVNKVARFAGKTVGNMVGLGDELGNASSWLSRAFGFGDYTIKKNSFQDYQNIAQFANHGTITFSHREFISDINSSTGFALQAFPINPGNSTLFPWLSTIAKNFEQYEFLGLIFEFKSTSATAVGSVNTGLGTVIMATDYDVLDSPYQDKRAMEVSEFSTSAPPCANQIHPIECDPKQNVMKQLFIQPGNNSTLYPDDARFSALGNFQIATSGMQAVSTIGELWVSYHIKLLKPQLENSVTRSTTVLHGKASSGVAGTAGYCTYTSNNPGALTFTQGSGARVKLTCTSVAGIGDYILSSFVIGSGADPTYIKLDSSLYTLGGSASIVSDCTTTGGAFPGQPITQYIIANNKSGTVEALSANPQQSFTIINFQAVGDSIIIPQPYSATMVTYQDYFVTPYTRQLVSNERVASKNEIQELREQLESVLKIQAQLTHDVRDIQSDLTEPDDEYLVSNSVVLAMITTLRKETVDSYTISQCYDRERNIKEALEFTDVSNLDREFLTSRLKLIVARSTYLSTVGNQ